MDAIEARMWADWIRRRRFCPFLFQLTWEYKSWSKEMKYLYQERLGLILGDSPVITAEAHVYALHQIVRPDDNE